MNTFLIISLVLFAAYLLYSRTISAVPSITNAELAQLRKEHPTLEIIDVRTPAEISSGKMPGAHEIDYMSRDFRDKIAELPKDQPYLVYCRSGQRSAGACNTMLKQGFEVVYNLRGGFRG